MGCKARRVTFFATLVILMIFQLAVLFFGFSTQHQVFQDTSFDGLLGAPRYLHQAIEKEIPSGSLGWRLQFRKELNRSERRMFRPEYKADAEGPFLADVQELLSTVKLSSMLDVGCSISGHMSQLFGYKFNRVVVLAMDPIVLNSLENNSTHPHAEFVLSDIIGFARKAQEKFDVVFLNMLLQDSPASEVAPTVSALETLLNDEGVGIISTTHAQEGHGGLYFNSGDEVEDEELNVRTNAVPGTPRMTRWTKSAFLEQLRGKMWEVTGHVVFTFYTEKCAREAWEQQERFTNRTFESFHATPVAQMAAVRRLITPYSSKFAAPLEPSTPSVRDVIFSLVRGGPEPSDYDELLSSRKCLRRALYQNTSTTTRTIDEVVFHEGNVPDHIKRSFEEELPGSRFIDIRPYGAYGGLGNGSGVGIYRWKPWARLRRPHEYPLGYRHMCRFMSMLWMHILSRYEYAARIDDDVCIHKMVNPFQHLRESNADYAYALVTKEKHLETIGTLSPWLDMYTRNRSIVPQTPLNVESMYFTNFFATNVSWWLGDSVRLFMHAVDRSGNIYHHRWGDAPLQTAALHMFAEPHRLKRVHVDYSHLSTRNEIRNGSEFALAAPVLTTLNPTSSGGFASNSVHTYERDWEYYFAPCAVADYFKLPGAPFKSHLLAIRALRDVLSSSAKDESTSIAIDINDYAPGELAYAVQIDVYGSPQPLPTEDMQGSARRNAMFRLISGKDRKHPEYKSFTFVEWTGLSASPCCEHVVGQLSSGLLHGSAQNILL